MEIFKQVAGADNPTEVKLQVSKSIGTLLIACSADYEILQDETIQVEIERANGSNFEITKGAVSLQRFMLATTYGDDAIVSDDNYQTIALCEICREGSIHLFEKDVLKVNLKNLKPTVSYEIRGIEEPTTSLEVYSYESKSMASDDTNKDFNVEGYDIAVLDINSDITEISYTVALSGGSSKIIKYDLFELRSMSRSIDPVAYVKKNGTLKSSFQNFVQLPLIAVSNLNIRKTQGSVVNLLLRNHI
ncbi:hypothetical protein [Flavobacterium marginilacus]|uniref:hypothetical protein n=1 Tax=Flavobacterium marginilacus TaxID=3003256 RepID=UPI00248DAAB1|nr:hypothetical protein [Flavobacterium marginilacus]